MIETFLLERYVGERSIRVTAKLHNDNKWHFVVVGDYIPTLSDILIEKEEEIYIHAKRYIDEWINLPFVQDYRKKWDRLVKQVGMPKHKDLR
jgi:hypothetical protein